MCCANHTPNRSAIGTLVERSSRFTILLHLPGRLHTAEAVRDALVAALAQVPAPLRRSLTWDQGKEMALHAGRGDIPRCAGRRDLVAPVCADAPSV